MRGKAIWLVSASLIWSVGCGNKKGFAGRERLEAPRDKKDVGVLIENAPSDDIEKILADFPEAQVRVLNKEHGLYEIFGVEQNSIADLTSGKTSVNEFIQFVEPRTPGKLSVPVPEGTTIPGLPACKGGRPTPTAVMTTLQPKQDLNGATLLQGTKIKVSAASSKPNSANPSALKSAIVVITPNSSLTGDQVVLQNEMEFSLDALGTYQVIVVVQDGAQSCAMDGTRFIATSNQPYMGPQVTKPNLDLSRFTHLKAIQAQQAWDIGQGEGVMIAIIDTGVNYNHFSLAGNLALNEKEIAGNGIDDDNNGFVDDVLGYDFVNKDEFPFDDDGHGSHVAGLAASQQFGVAKKAKILAIKGLTGIGGDIGTISAAIRYAVDRGARIINMSLGAATPLPHPALVAAIAYAESKNVLVVASAGNGDPMTGLGFSIDEIPFFPAGLQNANILSVGSFDATSNLSSYSNFGKHNVDVLAPGGAMPADPMISCSLDNPKKVEFVGMSGTSMAAPVVSGIAAQVIGILPAVSVADLKSILMSAGDEIPELANVIGSSRHINALKAVEAAQARNVLF